MLKNFFQHLLFYPSIVIGDGYLTATEGTLWSKFLLWLYGHEEMGLL